MTRPLRSVDAIRSDLEHPHTRALLQVHSTSVGDGPIGRLLRDVEPLLAAADGAQRECAELHDAFDAVRMVIDEAQARIRRGEQAKAWAVAAAVVASTTAPEMLLCSSVAPRLFRSEQPTMCALPVNHGGRHYADAASTNSAWWMP